MKFLGTIVVIVGGLYWYAGALNADDAPREYYPAAAKTPAVRNAEREAALDDCEAGPARTVAGEGNPSGDLADVGE